MRRLIFGVLISFSSVFFCMSPMLAQRGGQEWLTGNADAQRSSWIRADAKISRGSMQKPGFQFLWKVKLDNEAKQLNSLTQPVLVGNIIGYKGFKSLALVGGSSDTLYAIDDDLGRMYWQTRLSPSAPLLQNANVSCPGGLTAAATRPATLLPPPPVVGRGGRGPARSLVGQPDQGFPSELLAMGRGGAARGAVPPSAAGPAGLGGPPRGGGGGGFGQIASVFVLASDGMLHQLSVQTGKHVVTQPVKFLPPNAHASALIVVDDVLYTSTRNECGGMPNSVWAIDLTSPEKTTASWKTNGANVAGSAGPALGTDGTIYVATTDAANSSMGYGSSVVALEPKTLRLKDYFTQPKADFSTSPLVLQHSGKDLVAAAGKDGRVYILNAASLGSQDHHTPLSATPVAKAGADFAPDALATWQDTDGTRWILVPTASTIAAFKIVEQNGGPALQQAWVSREMTSPLPPIIINGVVFALSSGEYRPSGTTMTAAQRAQRSKPAILYALDGVTGKELWNSGTTITSFVHSSGLSGGMGQVYVGTYDSTLYAFGFPIEK